MSKTPDKGLKRVVLHRCQMRVSRPGCLHRPFPLAQRLRGVPTGRHPVSSGDCGQQLWYGSRLPLCSLSSVSLTFHRNCPTSLLPGLIPVSVDSRLMGLLRGHCLERSSLPPAPDPTVSPAPHQSVSLELPQEASSGLLLPAQMKMVLSATHPAPPLVLSRTESYCC